ncbi:L-ascorbate metabolism protein UlaG (beta-lactamase superfamily) [Paenibacillus sp. PastF-3]|jgi:L-ascorbate metabolism protein UlaG (beta-lactamase superfamily)|uniref:MBL fold metallo-hydrolase n=1 Tax=unclassified Paenibacillus TaxID=185978 RepID=UPI000BA0A834|nr:MULTISPECIES: MBL fold metallo-hydrolase [unclassified Paenibacillus]MDH6372414.1 L-ascorbate metabolism protein UlaG (beta-lactamase superfamily) [Paenibacillus sp. PastF-3]OZQ85182.1 MBL fold metallo-hydrolase [Paenibacillus sp. VTT E-133291]
MPKTRYHNVDNVSTDKSLKEFRQWREERRRKKKDYSYVVPNTPPKVSYLSENRLENTITWIGHSTFFLQYEGMNIITDPIWARRLGFEKRLGQPGIPLSEVPPIDLILISHSHYDHLHIASIRKLYRAGTTLVVPVGLKRKMLRKGFHNCVEMEWWQEIKLGKIKLSFVPTQHWTRRTPWDTNTSHWGGYILEPADSGNQKSSPNLYFAGDSGYFPGFKEIGNRYKIDIALMPIGAYEPEWFMTSQHVNPEEAIQAFLDVGAETMIPMHYGTFRLADDTAREALDRMENARVKHAISEERIRILGYGETLVVQKENRTSGE